MTNFSLSFNLRGTEVGSYEGLVPIATLLPAVDTSQHSPSLWNQFVLYPELNLVCSPAVPVQLNGSTNWDCKLTAVYYK